MPKRSRLPKGGNVGKKSRLSKMKFDSYYALESFLAGKGASHVLWDIVEMEKRASKDTGMSAKQGEMEDRVLMWWNTQMEKPDAVSQRPSYVMTYMLREAIRKRM